jgi:CubicO group peptidase (beta-lactamase class C family)
MAALRPTAALNKTFHYSNQMVAAAGFLAGRAAFPALDLGAAYDRAMTELLFHPLGMAATTLGFDEALRRPNLAWPHGFNAEGRLVEVSPAVNRSVGPARPSGGVWSNVNDMLRYVALELRDGQLADGQPLLSQAAMRERQTPRVSAASNVFYGLALVIDRSLGIPLLEHPGATAGYRSLVFWLPEHRVGAVVLANGDQGDILALLLQRRLLELVLGARPEAEAELPRQRALLRGRRLHLFRGLSLPADPRAVASLASRYRSPDLGGLQVRREGRRTLFDFGGFVSAVGSRRSTGGSWAFVTSDAGQAGLEFLSSSRDGLTLMVRENQHTYRYTAE